MIWFSTRSSFSDHSNPKLRITFGRPLTAVTLSIMAVHCVLAISEMRWPLSIFLAMHANSRTRVLSQKRAWAEMDTFQRAAEARSGKATR